MTWLSCLDHFTGQLPSTYSPLPSLFFQQSRILCAFQIIASGVPGHCSFPTTHGLRPALWAGHVSRTAATTPDSPQHLRLNPGNYPGALSQQAGLPGHLHHVQRGDGRTNPERVMWGLRVHSKWASVGREFPEGAANQSWQRRDCGKVTFR